MDSILTKKQLNIGAFRTLFYMVSCVCFCLHYTLSIAEAQTTNVVTNAHVGASIEFYARNWAGTTNFLGSDSVTNETAFWRWRGFGENSIRPTREDELGSSWVFVSSGIGTNGEFAYTDWWHTHPIPFTNHLSFTTNIIPSGPPPPPPPPPTDPPIPGG
jgi:hypothetical protein